MYVTTVVINKIGLLKKFCCTFHGSVKISGKCFECSMCIAVEQYIFWHVQGLMKMSWYGDVLFLNFLWQRKNR